MASGANPFDWSTAYDDELIGGLWGMPTATGGAQISTTLAGGLSASGPMPGAGKVLVMDVPTGGVLVARSPWASCTPGVLYAFEVTVAGSSGCLAIASLSVEWYDKSRGFLIALTGGGELDGYVPTTTWKRLSGGRFSHPDAYYGRLLLKADGNSGPGGAGIIYWGVPVVGRANLNFEIGPGTSPW